MAIPIPVAPKSMKLISENEVGMIAEILVVSGSGRHRIEHKEKIFKPSGSDSWFREGSGQEFNFSDWANKELFFIRYKEAEAQS